MLYNQREMNLLTLDEYYNFVSLSHTIIVT